MGKSDQVQGEGNYEAAEEYNEAQKKFVKSGKVEQAARNAEPKSEAEREELRRAEESGKERMREEDPAIRRGPDGKACK